MNEHLTKALHDLEFALESICAAVKTCTNGEDLSDLYACGYGVGDAIRKMKGMIEAPPSTVIKAKVEG